MRKKDKLERNKKNFRAKINQVDVSGTESNVFLCPLTHMR